MQLKIMTWNTALKGKNIENDEEKIKSIIDHIETFLRENPNAVAVLQEIPYKENVNWKADPVYTYFEKSFKNKYAVFANRDYNEGRLRMMTVIVTNITDATALTLWKHPDHPLNRECAVVVPCDGTNIVIYGIHASNGADNKPYLESLSAIAKKIDADIVLGDFNAGDYKECENWVTFNGILPEYTCICNGPTREVWEEGTLSRKTHIDHVFLKDVFLKDELLKAYYSELKIHVIIHDDVKLSDHYPITLEISGRRGG